MITTQVEALTERIAMQKRQMDHTLQQHGEVKARVESTKRLLAQLLYVLCSAQSFIA
jgi:hypothetical protein